jgi:hypothetical protein
MALCYRYFVDVFFCQFANPGLVQGKAKSAPYGASGMEGA